jgi:hypothetical protein
MKRLVLFMLCIVLVSGLGVSGASAAEPTVDCALKIIEIQTQAADGGDGSLTAPTTLQDLVIVGNTGAVASSSGRLHYRPAGVVSETSYVSVPAIPAGKSLAFVSSGLKPMNPAAKDLTYPIAKDGGTLTLAKGTSAPTATNTCDQVSWGTALPTEGQALAVGGAGTEYVRKQNGPSVQDMNNNANDFDVIDQQCMGMSLEEIQPYVVDVAGAPIKAWLEVAGATSDSQGCIVGTRTGDIYMLPAISDDDQTGLVVYDEALDAQGVLTAMHLGEESGQIWLGGGTVFSDSNGVRIVRTPISTAVYNDVSRGQTWALVDGLWKATYMPTPGEPNIYQLDQEPDACSAIRISEMLPSPGPGGSEWIELVNEANQPALLAECMVKIGSSEYYFASDDTLLPLEYRSFTALASSTGSEKTVSLTDSGATVELWRIHSDKTQERIQTVQSYIDGAYYNDELVTSAPEGASYARFFDGTQYYWVWLTVPTTNVDNAAVVEPPQQGGAVEGPEVPTTGPSGEIPNVPLTITELLPNPASPLTDDTDEFVELYNPSDVKVLLNGYKLQVGSNYSYSFAFTDETIEPKSYLLVTSGNSSISLANSGGRARLLDPSGAVIYETDSYASAPEGESWAYIDGRWQWTSQVTQSTDNVFAPPLIGALAKAKTAASTKKAAATPKTSTAKPKTTAVKSAKTASQPSKAASAVASAVAQVPPLHVAVLASVGLLAVLYAAYEYRTDITNAIYRFRRYRTDRRTRRPAPKRR